jgi:hypothetical protein
VSINSTPRDVAEGGQRHRAIVDLPATWAPMTVTWIVTCPAFRAGLSCYARRYIKRLQTETPK